jgi:hypothetical protein
MLVLLVHGTIVHTDRELSSCLVHRRLRLVLVLVGFALVRFDNIYFHNRALVLEKKNAQKMFTFAPRLCIDKKRTKTQFAQRYCDDYLV